MDYVSSNHNGEKQGIPFLRPGRRCAGIDNVVGFPPQSDDVTQGFPKLIADFQGEGVFP